MKMNKMGITFKRDPDNGEYVIYIGTHLLPSSLYDGLLENDFLTRELVMRAFDLTDDDIDDIIDLMQNFDKMKHTEEKSC